MLFELTLALLAGIVAGTITGLTPGIHVNLIASIFLAITLSLTTPLPIETIITFIVLSSNEYFPSNKTITEESITSNQHTF
jgi:TctA family transporter